MELKAHKIILLLIVAVAVLLSLTVFGQQQRRSSSKTWEYQTVTVSNEGEGAKELNELGSQGWELVAIQSTGEGHTTAGIYFLKRAK